MNRILAPLRRLRAMAILLVLLLFASCGARVDIFLAEDGSAAVEFQTKGDEAVFRNMLRKAAAFSGEEPPSDASGLVNEKSIRAGFEGRSDLLLLSLKKTDAVSVGGKAKAPKIEALALDPDDPSAHPFFRLEPSGSVTTLRFRLDRDNAARLPQLMPGLDPDLLELLAPPALFGDDLSAEEYRMNLQPFLGTANMPALDASSFEIRISPPGGQAARVTGHSGGTMEKGILVARISLLDLLVLDRAVELSLSWAKP